MGHNLLSERVEFWDNLPYRKNISILDKNLGLKDEL